MESTSFTLSVKQEAAPSPKRKAKKRAVWPPVSMTARCSQMGEPISGRFDPDNHRWRATYETFTKVAEDVWRYCGDCFRDEIVQRGKPLVYVGKGQS